MVVTTTSVEISDALYDPGTSLETLCALRDRARRTLEEIGDLPFALERLEAEIARRGDSGDVGGSGFE